MYAAKLTAALFVLLTLILGAVPTQAETVNCTPVTSLPAFITVQGVYCFTGDLSTGMTSGDAIAIGTNNVVLDLNGFKLGGLAAGPGTEAQGITATNAKNITIKNGTIRGFKVGIFMEAFMGTSEGHVLEDLRLDHNTLIGIEVSGTAVVVRNNHIFATGGSTTFGANANALGISVNGTGFRVLNNDVINTVKQGTGTATGISIVGSDTMAVNNRITGADTGLAISGTGKYRDNITLGVTTPFIGGTNIGNNN